MIALLFLAFPFVEIWLASAVAAEIGWLKTLAALAFDVPFGLALAQWRGRQALASAQAAAASGRPVDREAALATLGAIGGLLVALPGFASDAVGLALTLPLIREIPARLLRRWIDRRVRAGQASFRMGAFGGPFGGPFGDAFGGPVRRSPDVQERDVSPRAIDVVPLRSETRKVDGGSGRSSGPDEEGPA